jgi:hypothetical protein
MIKSTEPPLNPELLDNDGNGDGTGHAAAAVNVIYCKTNVYM